MLWSQFIIALLFTVISARPELSLEEIEKELEHLSAAEQDTAETKKLETIGKTTASDTEKLQSDPPKELLQNPNKVAKEELAAIEKVVGGKETDAKKDETEKKVTDSTAKGPEAETDATDKTTTDESAVTVGPPAPIKPHPPEVPARDVTGATENELLERFAPRPRFQDTPAYRRLVDALNSRPYAPHSSVQRGYYGFRDALESRPRWREAPYRRTMESDSPYDYPALPRPRAYLNEVPSGFRRRIDMTRPERMAMSAGSWAQGSNPVKVPARIPPLPMPDVNSRSFYGFPKQTRDENTEVQDKSGLTSLEMRKRVLMDLLAEKLERKANEAEKRGIKVPDKILEFLSNYKSRRSFNEAPVPDKIRFSH